MSVRTQPPPDEYADWHPREGFTVEWVEGNPARERLAIPAEVESRKCRRVGCQNPVAWALLRTTWRRATDTYSGVWWFYCADHHYGRKIEDGKLLHRRAVPIMAAETSR